MDRYFEYERKQINKIKNGVQSFNKALYSCEGYLSAMVDIGVITIDEKYEIINRFGDIIMD